MPIIKVHNGCGKLSRQACPIWKANVVHTNMSEYNARMLHTSGFSGSDAISLHFQTEGAAQTIQIHHWILERCCKTGQLWNCWKLGATSDYLKLRVTSITESYLRLPKPSPCPWGPAAWHCGALWCSCWCQYCSRPLHSFQPWVWKTLF